MTAVTAVLFVVAAAAGGVLRWAIVSWWYCTWQSLLAVNVAGSGLLGWLVTADVSTAALTVLGGAFAGSLTTFSAFAWEVRSSRPTFAVAYAGLTVMSCVGAVWVGASF